MYFLTVILIGTIYPIFLEVLNNEKISIGPPFFNKLIIPILIPFLFAMYIGPKLKWIKSDLKNKLNLIIFFLISLLISFLIIKNFDTNILINTILVTSAFYLFFITVKDFLIKEAQNLSQKLAHFGFSLLILSILLNNIFSTEIITNLKVGEKFESEKTKINFVSLETKEINSYSCYWEFIIENLNGDREILEPELRIYNQPNIVTSEADIKTNLFTDKFITINLV